MSNGLAPRPANEERRVQAVVKTGLVDSPNPDFFQVYCDLARDITGFSMATFSLFDGEMQCGMAATGRDGWEAGGKTERTETNLCSYVLLETEPLIFTDSWAEPDWQWLPVIKARKAPRAYAGFPVINKDNYALGTLCLMNMEPKTLSKEQITMIKKITQNLAHLLDIQTEQKEITSHKILDALKAFQACDSSLTMNDFKTFITLCSDMPIADTPSASLLQSSLVFRGESGAYSLSADGRTLQGDMKLQAKVMKKFKIEGDAAEALLNEMLTEVS
ncbi:MAG: GAF domain-containing protein [Alphaproteobacteria bacterium]|nr:GAF domain-containing protein [Alphaproteobacteria bacterium]